MLTGNPKLININRGIPWDTMKEVKMRGIYCFKNKLNGKRYVGQSVQLEQRYSQHIRGCLNPNTSMYNGKFYRALRKYGIDNFEYTILAQSENFSKEELNELEIYFIEKYNCFYEGYNMNLGGNYTSSEKKLNKDIVHQIKGLIKDSSISFTNIAKEYQVEVSLISMINSGRIWNEVNEIYPLREDTFSNNKGGTNPSAIIANSEVMIIRHRFVNETLSEIYFDYCGKLSFSELKKDMLWKSI